MLNISFPPGSVGIRIPKMLELFKYGHEYFVESDCYIRTQIATVRLIKRAHEDQISCKYVKQSQKIKAEFLSTARHAQRAHFCQSAHHPAGRLLPPTCWHGYVHQSGCCSQTFHWSVLGCVFEKKQNWGLCLRSGAWRSSRLVCVEILLLLLPFSTSDPLTFAVANGAFRGSRENSAGGYISVFWPHSQLIIVQTWLWQSC